MSILNNDAINPLILDKLNEIEFIDDTDLMRMNQYDYLGKINNLYTYKNICSNNLMYYSKRFSDTIINKFIIQE